MKISLHKLYRRKKPLKQLLLQLVKSMTTSIIDTHTYN